MPRSIALSFDPVEDRLALTIVAASGEERIVHLTRRVTRSLAGTLEKMAKETAEPPPDSDERQRGDLAVLHHEALAEQTSIHSERVDRKDADPADRPLLVTGVRAGRTRTAPVRWLLEFSCVDKQTIKLNLSARMLHGFIELLRRRLPGTQWGIDLLAAPADGARHRLVVH